MRRRARRGRYNAGFEKGRLEDLALAAPGQAAALRDIVSRLVDPLPVVREHVYHPDFEGSFSLKTVLPALVPDLGYGDLAIADGDTASRELTRLVLADAAFYLLIGRARASSCCATVNATRWPWCACCHGCASWREQAPAACGSSPVRRGVRASLFHLGVLRRSNELDRQGTNVQDLDVDNAEGVKSGPV